MNIIEKLKTTKTFVFEINDGKCFINNIDENYYCSEELKLLKSKYIEIAQEIDANYHNDPTLPGIVIEKANEMRKLYDEIVKKALVMDKDKKVESNIIRKNEDILLQQIKEFKELCEYEVYAIVE